MGRPTKLSQLLPFASGSIPVRRFKRRLPLSAVCGRLMGNIAGNKVDKTHSNVLKILIFNDLFIAVNLPKRHRESTITQHNCNNAHGRLGERIRVLQK